MAKLKIFASVSALLLVAACGGADGQFSSSCQSMMKQEDNMTKTERDQTCDCLADSTEGLGNKDKKTLAKMMRTAGEDDDLRKDLEEAVDKKQLTEAGASAFFQGVKTCSLNNAF